MAPFVFEKSAGRGRRDLPNLPPYPDSGDRKEEQQWHERLYDVIRGILFSAIPAPAGVVTNNFNVTITGGPAGTPGTPGANGTIIGPIVPTLVVYGGAAGELAQAGGFLYDENTLVQRQTVPRLRLYPLLSDVITGVSDSGGALLRPGYPPLQFDPDVTSTSALVGTTTAASTFLGSIEYAGEYFWGTDYLGVRRPFAWGASGMPAIGPFTANQILYGDDASSGGIDQSAGLTFSDSSRTLTVSGSGSSVTHAITNTRAVTVSYARTLWSAASLVALDAYADGIGTTVLGTPGGLFGTSSTHPLGFQTDATLRMHITAAGLIGIGSVTPSGAILNLEAGSTLLAPLRFASGNLKTSAVVGGVEFVSTATTGGLYATMDGPTRCGIAIAPTATAYTANGVAYGSGAFAHALTTTAAGATGTVLGGNTGAAPSFQTLAAAGLVAGTGTNLQVALWNGTATQTGNASFVVNSTTATTQVGIGAVPITTYALRTYNTANNLSGIYIENANATAAAAPNRDVNLALVNVTRSWTVQTHTAGTFQINDNTAGPLNRLQINTAGLTTLTGTGGSTVDLIVNGRIRTGDGGSAGGVWLNSGTTQFIGQNGTHIQLFNGSIRMNVSDAGLVSVGAATAAHTSALDVQFGGISLLLGANSSSFTRSDTTNKVARVGCAHYTNAELPLGLIVASSSSSANTMSIGGGSSLFNAATTLNFYTGATITTPTGTVRMSISSAGVVNISNLTVSSAVYTDASNNLTSTPPAGSGLTASGPPSADQWAYWTTATNLTGATMVASGLVYTDASKRPTSTAPATNTYTPTVTLSGAGTVPTYTTKTGRYTRTGNFVFFSIYLNGDGGTAGTGTTTLTVSLPITISASQKAGFISAGAVSDGNAEYGAFVVPAVGGTTVAVHYDASNASPDILPVIGTMQAGVTRTVSLDFWVEI